MVYKGYALLDALTGQVAGEFLPTGQVTTITSTPYNVLVTDNFIICGAGSASVVLPSAVTSGAGKRFIVKNNITTKITITSLGGNMDDETTLYLAVEHQSLVFESDGTNWLVPYAYKTPPVSIAGYSDSTTQAHGHVGGAADAYPVQFDTTDDEHGITRDNGGAGTTVTISNATPAVVTWAAHDMQIGDTVYFETTDTLPTGITANTKYYINTAGFAAGEFQIAAFPEDTSINTSCAGAGTHTGHDSGNIRFTSTGHYIVMVSAIADADANQKSMDLWLYVDGVNVANTNTIVQLPTANTEVVLAVPFIVVAVDGTTMQLRTAADDTGVQMKATAAQANPARPACPSIIVGIFKVSK